MNGGGDLVPHGTFWNVQIRHRAHIFDTGQSIARRVGVHRGKRSLVTSVHGLQHVKSFLAADLTNHDAVGAHTQTVDHQLPLSDCAFAFYVGWARFQADYVLLLHLQFGRVFDGDDAIRVWDVA